MYDVALKASHLSWTESLNCEGNDGIHAPGANQLHHPKQGKIGR